MTDINNYTKTITNFMKEKIGKKYQLLFVLILLSLVFTRALAAGESLGNAFYYLLN